MNPSEYRRYLASREWALLKEAVRRRSDGRCERCRHGEYEETHHVTYERIGNERLEDLMAVCSLCHKFLSGKTDYDPANPPQRESAQAERVNDPDEDKRFETAQEVQRLRALISDWRALEAKAAIPYVAELAKKTADSYEAKLNESLSSTRKESA